MPSAPTEQAGAHSLIGSFTRHPLAANLLMILLILAGFWAIRQLTVQLNPGQPATTVEVLLSWPGAAAEDIEKLVTQPVEYQLRGLQNLRSMTSTTQDSSTRLELQFVAGTNMGEALDRVKQQFDQARDLPPDLEPAAIRLAERLETIAAILLSGPGPLAELIPLAHQIERELMARGADHVEFRGIPKEEIAIQIDSQTLFELGVPLHEIAAQILANSRDMAAGSVGGGQLTRQLRSLDQRRSSQGFATLPVSLGEDGPLTYLGNIALIERRQQDDQRLLYHDGEAAIMIRLRRSPGSDVMEQADILRQWHAERAPVLAQQGIEATVWLEVWRFARDTLMLVVNNGISGMFLVVATLFLFLNTRVAAWVTLGIPISFLGALAVFYFLGGSINFISLIGAVMALGIVVDDAIVVGEHALARFENGASPEDAAALGARRMFAPVLASSLTTLAAFLPLLVIEDAFIREIPLLMVCVIIASLVECFLIMPGHLRHSFARMRQRRPGRFRQRFDQGFKNLVERRFLPFISVALDNRRAVLGFAIGAFVVALALLVSGRVKTELSMQVEFEFADVHLQFAPGVTQADKNEVLGELEQALLDTNEALGGDVIVTHIRNSNWAQLEQQARSGSQYAAIEVELVSPERRAVTLQEFTDAWRQRVSPDPRVEIMEFSSGEDSWPDLQLYLSGGDLPTLKAAAEDLGRSLASYPGIINVFDDLPYGSEQWLFQLTTEGRAAGLTSSGIGRQLQAAFHGERIQLFTENDTELEVRVSLPAEERLQAGGIDQLPITTPSGAVLPLASVASMSAQRGIERINHRNGLRVVNVYANINRRINTPMAVIADLEANVIPALVQRYGISYGLGERSDEEAQVLADMLLGAIMALLLIYLILAWMFASWSWPLAVMVAIPLGLTGALAGLQIMDLNLGSMAIMGLFTLTGVIINDSIILITAYKGHKEAGLDSDAAMLQACRERLRPVLLTSVTTTLGLAPMMLESSPMGEAMAPLAVVICFGLLYGTTLILVTIPALLSLLDRRRAVATTGITSPDELPATLPEGL
ncbi:efflux RND transporter permease subunit [Kineobactrum salinum]|uniref:Efflux RND transporter permease subunit n=1 Tax=Kineobactrum salinum TaxID=2708301 RepID=A0A6C0U3Z9_9GAMM|nr:efflux RND transporter permease subunit [Kineobactrum salinum]QIB66668.1 efflux RND transporter permease subunit [Kineobactrum salinum]